MAGAGDGLKGEGRGVNEAASQGAMEHLGGELTGQSPGSGNESSGRH